MKLFISQLFFLCNTLQPILIILIIKYLITLHVVSLFFQDQMHDLVWTSLFTKFSNPLSIRSSSSLVLASKNKPYCPSSTTIVVFSSKSLEVIGSNSSSNNELFYFCTNIFSFHSLSSQGPIPHNLKVSPWLFSSVILLFSKTWCNMLPYSMARVGCCSQVLVQFVSNISPHPPPHQSWWENPNLIANHNY